MQQYTLKRIGLFIPTLFLMTILVFVVMSELGDRMPRTLELAVLAIVLSVIFSVPLGVISTIKPDSWLDFGTRTFTIVGIAIPNFLMAIYDMAFIARVTRSSMMEYCDGVLREDYMRTARAKGLSERVVSVKPRPKYAPLFAYALWRQHVAGGARSS